MILYLKLRAEFLRYSHDVLSRATIGNEDDSDLRDREAIKEKMGGDLFKASAVAETVLPPWNPLCLEINLIHGIFLFVYRSNFQHAIEHCTKVVSEATEALKEGAVEDTVLFQEAEAVLEKLKAFMKEMPEGDAYTNQNNDLSSTKEWLQTNMGFKPMWKYCK